MSIDARSRSPAKVSPAVPATVAPFSTIVGFEAGKDAPRFDGVRAASASDWDEGRGVPIRRPSSALSAGLAARAVWPEGPGNSHAGRFQSGPPKLCIVRRSPLPNPLTQPGTRACVFAGPRDESVVCSQNVVTGRRGRSRGYAGPVVMMMPPLCSALTATLPPTNAGDGSAVASHSVPNHVNDWAPVRARSGTQVPTKVKVLKPL